MEEKMKRFIDLWNKKEKQIVVYWKCKNGKMLSAIKTADGTFSTICAEDNAIDMKSKTSKLLASINGDAKLIWKKAV